MKQIFSLLLFTCLGSALFAQSKAAVVFSENGEAFTLLLNGVKQNDQPSANVELNDLDLDFYQARVDFEDASLADFNNNNFALHPGFKVTYMIKINRKGKYVLRFQSETPYSETEAAEAIEVKPTRSIVQEEAEVIEMETTGGGSTVTQTVNTSTKTSAPESSDKVSIEMSAPGVDIGFKMNVDIDTDMEISEETTFTQETTVTESSSYKQEPSKLSKPKPEPPVVDYRDHSGCAYPEDDLSFAQIKKSISSKTFEDSKMTIAKQIVKNKCITAVQVKEIMELFTYEESKLDFAMFAYDHTFDQDNYYMVNDAFDFELTIDELNEFIESK
ncbi:MAG: DUF4476 domain-containing protein [Flavobacteriales bacterium]